MKFSVDERFLEQAARYNLKLWCEECVHFDAEQAVCSEGYPSGPHRQRQPSVGEALWFCKHFEVC